MDNLEDKLSQRTLSKPGDHFDKRMDDVFFEAATQHNTNTVRRVGPWSLITACLVGVLTGFLLGRYESPVDEVVLSQPETHVFIIRSDEETGRNLFEVSQPPRPFLSEPMEPEITIYPLENRENSSTTLQGEAS